MLNRLCLRAKCDTELCSADFKGGTYEGSENSEWLKEVSKEAIEVN